MTAIRLATPHDASELARLLTQLGHATEATFVAESWDAWSGENNSALVATREDGTLAGVATTHWFRVLHRPLPVGRITALIVDAPDRGSGIGRALVAAAESALATQGCGLIEITSNIRRTDAHAFYERLGYERTSIRLAKNNR